MEKPVAAADCIHSIIANRSESEHFFVCTQDRQLVSKLQKIPGCPVIFFKMNAIHLDKPTQASRQKSKEQLKERLIGKDELEKLKKLKEENQISTANDSGRKKRKVPKGPNPNSCRKRKSSFSHQDRTEETNKRKRKRDRQKVPKHIRTLLDEHKVDVWKRMYKHVHIGKLDYVKEISLQSKLIQLNQLDKFFYLERTF